MRRRPPTRTVYSFIFFLLFVAPPLLAQTPIPAEVLAEIPGTVIVGGGKGGEAVRSRLVETAGGANAKLVILFDGDEKEEQRFVDAWSKYSTAAVQVEAIRDRKKADDAEMAKKIAVATGVWIEPGDATKLAATLTGTAVERELRKLLERGGVLGSESSSATLFGKTTPTGEKGLALLPNAIVETHLLKRNRIDPLLAALAKQPGLVGLGVDEGTVVVVKGRRVTVSGDSYAAVCLNPSTKRPASVQLLKDRGEADLLALQRAAFLRTQPPYPPEKPASPEVPKGTLVIGGGGGMPQDIVKRFIQLAGGPDALIVVIPTALEDPLPEEIGEVTMLKRAGARERQNAAHARAQRGQFAGVHCRVEGGERRLVQRRPSVEVRRLLPRHAGRKAVSRGAEAWRRYRRFVGRRVDSSGLHAAWPSARQHGDDGRGLRAWPGISARCCGRSAFLQARPDQGHDRVDGDVSATAGHRHRRRDGHHRARHGDGGGGPQQGRRIRPA